MLILPFYDVNVSIVLVSLTLDGVTLFLRIITVSNTCKRLCCSQHICGTLHVCENLNEHVITVLSMCVCVFMCVCVCVCVCVCLNRNSSAPAVNC